MGRGCFRIIFFGSYCCVINYFKFGSGEYKFGVLFICLYVSEVVFLVSVGSFVCLRVVVGWVGGFVDRGWRLLYIWGVLVVIRFR